MAGWWSQRRVRWVPVATPYKGPGTAEVAATFLDPRTGEVVEEVPVGDTDEGYSWRRFRGGQPGPAVGRRDHIFGHHVIDSRTREVITTIELTSEGDGDRTRCRGEHRLERGVDAGRCTAAARQRGCSRRAYRRPGLDARRRHRRRRHGDLERGGPGRHRRRPGAHRTRPRAAGSLAAASPNSNESQILDADTLEVLDAVRSVGGRPVDQHGRSPRTAACWRVLASAGACTSSTPGRGTRGSRCSSAGLVPPAGRVAAGQPDRRRRRRRTGASRLFDAERLLARAGPLPASAGGESGLHEGPAGPGRRDRRDQRPARGTPVPDGSRGVARGGVCGRPARPHPGRVGPLPAGPGVPAHLHRPGVGRRPARLSPAPGRVTDDPSGGGGA